MPGLGNVQENKMKSEGDHTFLPFISSPVFYHPKATGYRTKQLPVEVVSAKCGVCLKFTMTTLRVALKHKLEGN